MTTNVSNNTLPHVDGDAQAWIDTAQMAVNPVSLEAGDVVGITIPAGAQHHVIDLEGYLDAPRRKRGTVTLTTPDSFAAYVGDHRDTGTALYADIVQVAVTAVIDGHISEGDAGWGQHRARFNAQLTPEWKAWKDIDGRYIDQGSFAEFIEEHAETVVSPSSADMLELAQSFEATTAAEFKSATRLHSGERQLRYTQTISPQAGQNGELTVPEKIELGLQPFEGAGAYRLNARFRFRLEGGHVRFSVVLDRPDKVLRVAFDEVLATIGSSLDGVALYHGFPPT